MNSDTPDRHRNSVKLIENPTNSLKNITNTNRNIFRVVLDRIMGVALAEIQIFAFPSQRQYLSHKVRLQIYEIQDKILTD